MNLQPIFLASLTTTLGFLSMNFSEVPPFRQLGNFVAFGVGAAFVLSVTFLPALLSLLPVRVPAAGHHRLDGAMPMLAELVVRRRRELLWGGGLIAVALVASIPRNELNDVFLHYFDESIEFRRDADFITRNLTGMYALEYSLGSGEPGGIGEPAYLADVAAFAEWYQEQPETIHVDVITDTFRRLNMNMHGDDPAEYRLPASRELAAQYLLLYEMSLPPGLDLNHRIDIDRSATRMVASTRTLSTNEVLALDRRALEWLADNAPHIVRPESSGTTLMFAYLGRRNIVSMLVGTTIALVGISLVLILALRSLRLGLTSLVPNLVPGALGFGVWGLAVGEVGISLSVVTAMTLGIVVDDTVHFLSKYRRARHELGCAPPDAVRVAFRTVGRALFTTSVVLVAGFIVVSLSSFELNAGMGKLTALVIALALLADFFLLPPLLMKVEGGKGARNPRGSSRRTRARCPPEGVRLVHSEHERADGVQRWPCRRGVGLCLRLEQEVRRAELFGVEAPEVERAAAEAGEIDPGTPFRLRAGAHHVRVRESESVEVDAILSGAEVVDVVVTVSVAEDERVRSSSASQAVVAGATFNPVVAVPAFQPVVAGASVQEVVAVAATYVFDAREGVVEPGAVLPRSEGIAHIQIRVDVPDFGAIVA